MSCDGCGWMVEDYDTGCVRCGMCERDVPDDEVDDQPSWCPLTEDEPW